MKLQNTPTAASLGFDVAALIWEKAMTPNTATIGALNEFLNYGPIGFAGLMLVLVIIALNVPKIDPHRAGLLRQFLYVGSFCFAVAMIAQFFGATHMVASQNRSA
jgi:hypothetical protein